MDLPGHYAPSIDSDDSDNSFSPALMDHLEAVAHLSDSQDISDDPDWDPNDALAGAGDVLIDDDDDEDDDFVDEDEDEEEDADPQETTGNQAAGAQARADRGGGLQIGYDPSSGTVMLISDDGTPRRLTAADLEGTSITLGAIRAMLARRFGNSGALAADEEMDDDDDESDGGADWWGPTRRTRKQFYPPIKEPQEAGIRLERGGAFGPVPRKYDHSLRKTWDYSPNAADYLRWRELDFRQPRRDVLGEMMLPNSAGVEVSQFTSKVYSGQYSSDGNFFYTACQDFRVYIYDTATPPRVGDKSVTDSSTAHRTRSGFLYDWEHRSSLKLTKIVRASPQNCRWTLTDAELSADNEWLIYSSISPRAHMVKTGRGQSSGGTSAAWDDAHDVEHEQEELNFSSGAGRSMHGGFGIWSLRFSHDAREVVAGASDGQIFVYDVESRRTVLRVRAHRDDVNAVAFGSASDSNLLLSGSDDSFVKVWDRRSLDGEKPSGTCVGHTEGVTYVEPKGDGRYILSNGKDQAAKLFDLRMMMSDVDFERLRLDRRSFGIDGWDYRQSFYTTPRYQKHPHDNSVMTYRGHAVLRTLIRCHFSPMATTNQRYIYSGSSDGKIHIWSLDGMVVGVLDRQESHPLSNQQTGEYNDPSDWTLRTTRRESRRSRGSAVRDVSWHPYEPMMMSTAWEEGRGQVAGSIALHEWAGAHPGAATAAASA
ncbi:hypothetical protein JCM10908_001043 [Rhodotorula pacifica]|uniref:uncharacterized protein n=1 Tax=Rhodotorula pacifica TaxID=1495444 RepID=UPI0031797DBE